MADTDELPILAYGIHGRSGKVVLLTLEEMEALSGFFSRLLEVVTVGDYLQLEGDPSGAFRWWHPDDYTADELAELAPSPDQPFDITMVPAFGDGYFPPDPLTWMWDAFEWDEFGLPDGVAEYRDYMASLPQVVIDKDRLADLLGTLRDLGYTVVERQDLVDPML